MSAGLHYIHSQNLVHRSINPKNILIQASCGGCPCFKISDFGISVPSWEDYELLHSYDFFKWSTWYHSPELIKRLHNRQDKFDPRTNPFGTFSGDIFSLGCVFFTFLTKGKHPFAPKGNRGTIFIEEYILWNLSNLHCN